MKTIRLTMAQALIHFLNNQYIEIDGKEIKFVKGVIGVFGHGNVLGIGEALVSLHDDNFSYIAGKNEQNNGHIAIGFAKQNRRKQIYAVTSSIGPGAANMITAAATATVNRIPVLFLPGDTYACRQPDPALQQLEQAHDYTLTTNDAFRPVSKYWDRVNRPDQLMTAAINAMRVLTDPAETGAVTLALPQDVQAEAFDYPEEFLSKRVWSVDRHPITDRNLEKVVRLIANKKKPVVICGGGVIYSEAGEEIKMFCEAINVPLTETAAGKGTVASDYKYNLGAGGSVGGQSANLALAEADIILAFGTRMSDLVTSSKWIYPETAIITFNINKFDAIKMNAFAVQADAKIALRQLTAALKNIAYTSGYKNEIGKWKNNWITELNRQTTLKSKDGLRQAEVLRLINDLIEDNAIAVAASGSLPGDMQRSWRVKRPDTYHLEYGYSCMGYEISGGIGAKLANPDQPVYVFMGDGVFLMNHADLHTSLQEKEKLILIVLDNCGHMCIRELQNSTGIKTFGTDFRYRQKGTTDWEDTFMRVDYAMIARGYGAKGYTATTLNEVREAVLKAQKEEITTLIDIKVLPDTWVPHYNSWWRTGVPEISEISRVRKAYEEDFKPNCDKVRRY
jgi:3D-(3,5/4)-trihydroxycyclohexane-1,2-dione acylhydrolase (decyclizing)